MTDPLGFSSHNHARCIAGSVATVEAACAAQKLQLTPVRRRVLEILLQEHRALGAYEILDRLRERGLRAPPQVYRALERLLAGEQEVWQRDRHKSDQTK